MFSGGYSNRIKIEKTSALVATVYGLRFVNSFTLQGFYTLLFRKVIYKKDTLMD